MSRFSVQYTVKNVAEAMKSGVAKGIIRIALKEQGFPRARIDTIMRWAERINKVHMVTYHLHRWSVGFYENGPYQAPEQRRTCLFGYRDEEATKVRTSPIVSIHGREIHTENNIYILEDIDPDYLQWLHDSGLTYDANDPIKLRKL